MKIVTYDLRYACKSNGINSFIHRAGMIPAASWITFSPIP